MTDVARDLEARAAALSDVDRRLTHLERSGQLAMQSKQVEALIESLRTECAMATALERSIRGQREEED